MAAVVESSATAEEVKCEETKCEEEAEGACGEGAEKPESAAEKKKAKKKKKRNNQAKKKKEKQQFEKWCAQVLQSTEHLVKDIPPEKLLAMPPEFKNYSFTGPLRPCYVTKQATVPQTIQQPDYAKDGVPHSEREEKKNPVAYVYKEDEIEKMRHVCGIAREVLDTAGRFLKAGVTGDEIDRIAHAATIERGGYPSPLNYVNFRKSLCVSANEIICHGIPDCRVIEEGDIINLDVSVYKDGFHSDLNETFLIGKCDEDSKRLVRTAYDCLQKAQELIRPGTFYRDVGPVISRVAGQNKCSVVKTYCGHGVGKHFHCAPNVPHYAKNKAKGIMRPGHIFTIEPMINDGSNFHDVLWPDDWTAATASGKRSAQFEHTFLVTEDGCEILTARKNAPKDKMVWDEQAIQR